MSENGLNALQQMEILNLGQLLNLVTNETKVKIKTLEKLHKSLITNAYGIIFNRTCFNERLLPNFTNIYIFNIFITLESRNEVPIRDNIIHYSLGIFDDLQFTIFISSSPSCSLYRTAT